MATYLSCKDSIFVVDGVTLAAEKGDLMLDVETDEVTNIRSGGYHEDVPTKNMAKFSGISAIYDGEEPPTFREGEKKTVTWNIPGGPSFSGECRFSGIKIPALDVKAALRLGFDLTSQGVYTFSWGGS